MGLAIICYLPCSDYYPEPDQAVPDPAYMNIVDVYVSDHPDATFDEALFGGRPFAGAIATALHDKYGYGQDDVGMTCITWYMGDIPCECWGSIGNLINKFNN